MAFLGGARRSLFSRVAPWTVRVRWYVNAANGPQGWGGRHGYTRDAMTPTAELASRLLEGDVRALARGIRLVEDRDPAARDLLLAVRGHSGAHVVGITGPPGSGKSTLCDLVIERWRAAGHSVGVIAVDPSSPFSGGAILGDRIRMQRHSGDRGVYIRSMAARGHLGGLAWAARDAVRLLEASGKDRCLLETVGVGQSELEVMQAADTTVVVTTPSSGDAVQIIKAGILEIADIFVVNKADQTGAARVAKELREMVHHARHSTASPHARYSHGEWEPPVILTQASIGDKVDELVDAIERHREMLVSTGELERRHTSQLRAEVEAIVIERASERARKMLSGETMAAELSGDPRSVDPHRLADQILSDNDTGATS